MVRGLAQPAPNTGRWPAYLQAMKGFSAVPLGRCGNQSPINCAAFVHRSPPKKLGALQLETPLLSGVHEEQSAIRQLV